MKPLKEGVLQEESKGKNDVRDARTTVVEEPSGRELQEEASLNALKLGVKTEEGPLG